MLCQYVVSVCFAPLAFVFIVHQVPGASFAFDLVASTLASAETVKRGDIVVVGMIFERVVGLI